MSAPSRGRGGEVSRGSSTTNPFRGSSRAAFSNTSRGRGRGRGSTAASASGITNGEGILQKLRTGTLQRNGDVPQANARGRGVTARGQSNTTRAKGVTARSSKQTPAPRFQASMTTPATTSNYRDFTNQMSEKYNVLKPRRDAERKKAIKDGFLSDPDQKTSLDKAITPVGTCTEMCPEFERVERIVQNMVDKAEKIADTASGRDIPSEERMVKRFRRSAAGYDEQLPSDIRTPKTLKKTLDYLLEKIVGTERLASIHKFVWDRTRGIRNDFSIQQVSKQEDVKIAVDCYERIARFHILAMHQLSNPDNLQEGEHFEAQQEREQLNNTLLSLMYYYDDHRDNISFRNEAEFRAYCILFELQSLHPDLEERMQSWPQDLLRNPKVQTAFKIYSAAGNSIFDQGPLRPYVPYPLAQSNPGKFWTIMASREVSYMMACVAEITFNQVRFAALEALWRSGKSAPQGQQARNQEWTMSELTNHLGFDDEEQTLEFVQEFGLGFGTAESGESYLDMTSLSSNTLDKSSIPSQQIFSGTIVEEKRYRRTLVSVINGVGIAAAIRQGLVVEAPQDDNKMDVQDVSEDDQSLFIAEQSTQSDNKPPTFGSLSNPEASAFTPSAPATSQTIQQQPIFGTKFGSSASDVTPKSFFGSTPPTSTSQPILSNTQTTTPSSFNTGFGKTGFGFSSQPGFRQPTQPSISSVFKGAGPTEDSADTTGFASKSIDSGLNLGQSQPNNPFQASSPATSMAGSTSAQTDLTTAGPPRFTQTTSGSNSSENTSTASPISTFFGQKIFGQQAKELEKQKEEKVTEVTGNPAPTFTFAPAPASTPASTPPSSFAPSIPTQASQSPQPVKEAPKTPHFSWTSNSQAPVQQNKNISSHASTVFDRGTQNVQRPSLFPTVQSSSSKAPTTDELAKPAPVFNFTNTTESPRLTTGPSLSAKEQEITSSATPLGTPVQQQTSNIFNFTTSEEPKNPAQVPHIASPLSTPRAQPASTQFSTQNVSQSPTTIRQSSSASTQLQVTKIDHTERVTQEAARLLLVQSQGLFEYFIGNHISSILIDVVKKYQKAQQDSVLTYVRTRLLSRKYFHLWKHTIQQRVLDRRAKQRRKMLAVAMKTEKQKQRRNEEQLEQIIAAAQESKEIQARQKRVKQEADSKKVEIDATSKNNLQASQSAGQKRKVLPERDNKRSFSGIATPNGTSHKRTRTEGTISEPSFSIRSSLSSNATHRQSTVNSRFTQSFLGRPSGSGDLKRSTTGQKVDNTKSDYFKLKAMGIDPDTPLIPDTARSLAAKEQKRQQEREATFSRIRGNHIAASPPSSYKSRSFGTMSPPPNQISALDLSVAPVKSQSKLQAPQAASVEEDVFLRELREAREAMSQDTEWFRAQTTQIGKEVEQREVLQKSEQDRHTRSIRAQSLHTSTSGFALANGYEYLPGEFKPSRSLSRTEQRIRKTGAHGLATKVSGSTSDYVPVAMSKRSALRYSMSSQDDDLSQARISTKRVRNEGYQQHATTKAHQNEHFPSPASKRPRNDKPQPQLKARPLQSARNQNYNAFAALNDVDQNQDQDDEEEYHYENAEEGDTEDADESEEDFDDEEDDGEGTQSTGNHHYISKQFHAGSPVYDDEEGVEEEIDEEDDGDEDDSYGYNSAFTYPTISRGTSRSATGSQAQSQAGPGASVDDALVLSD